MTSYSYLCLNLGLSGNSPLAARIRNMGEISCVPWAIGQIAQLVCMDNWVQELQHIQQSASLAASTRRRIQNIRAAGEKSAGHGRRRGRRPVDIFGNHGVTAPTGHGTVPLQPGPPPRSRSTTTLRLVHIQEPLILYQCSSRNTALQATHYPTLSPRPRDQPAIAVKCRSCSSQMAGLRGQEGCGDEILDEGALTDGTPRPSSGSEPATRGRGSV